MAILNIEVNEDWESLAWRSRGRPVVPGKPVVQTAPYGVTLRIGWGNRILCLGVLSVLVGAPLAIGCLAYGLPGAHSDSVIPLLLGGVLGCLIFAVGVVLALRVGRVDCSRDTGAIKIHYGIWPMVKSLRLPPGEMSATLSVDPGEMNDLHKGHTRLILTCPDCYPPEVVLASCSRSKDLTYALYALSRIPCIKTWDDTLVHLALADGTETWVSATPLRHSVIDWNTMALRFPSPDVAVFRRSIPLVLFWLLGTCLSGWGLGFFICDYAQNSEARSPAVAIFVVGLSILIFLCLLSCLLGGGVACRRLVADRASGTITHTSGIPCLGSRVRVLPLRDVVAVQMVPRNVQKQKGKHSYEIVPICEMNLVLRSAGERLGVMSGREGVYIAGVAMDFARFLGVRLLDHSDRLPR